MYEVDMLNIKEPVEYLPYLNKYRNQSKYNKDVYKLENSKVNITAVREQFKILSSIDYKEVFSIR